jgi:(2Fe-2S) ferredoxin
MLRYRPAGGASAEANGWAPFVRDVLLRPGGATSATPGCAPLAGAYAFVCAHAKRDKRCGVCGPPLIAALRAAAAASGAPLAVRACSHVGGHAYAGNVLVFDRAAGVPRGTWLGYVAPEDVPAIVDDLVGRGAPPQPRLWCACPMLRRARFLTPRAVAQAWLDGHVHRGGQGGGAGALCGMRRVCDGLRQAVTLQCYALMLLLRRGPRAAHGQRVREEHDGLSRSAEQA